MSRPSLSAMQNPWAEIGDHRHLPVARGGRPRRHAFGLAIVVVVVVTAVAVGASARGTGHPGGDPGGRILAGLESVRGVVPANATDVSITTHDSAYNSKCPDKSAGKSGWDDVNVVSTFRSTLAAQDLVAGLGDKLTHLGWNQVTPAWDHNFDQFPPQAAWRKTLLPGQTATATVYQLPPGAGAYSGSWHFSAIAKPPGFALPGC